MKKRFVLCVIVASLAVFALALAGCAEKAAGTFSSDIDEETGAYIVTADGADAESGVGMLGGGMIVEEGQVLMVGSDLSAGSIELRILDTESNPVAELTVEGALLQAVELEAGEYEISAKCVEKGTTGTLTVTPVTREEFEAANAELSQAA